MTSKNPVKLEGICAIRIKAGILIDRTKLVRRYAKLTGTSLSIYKAASAPYAKICYPCGDIMDVNYCGREEKYFWATILLSSDNTTSIGFSSKEVCEKWIKALKNSKSSSTLSEWIKDPSTIQKGELLGTGAYGKVWKGVMSGTPVAIKEMHRTGEDDDNMEKEILLLAKIHNPYCVRLLGICKEPNEDDRFCLITELVDQGDLTHVLKKNPNQISEMTKLKILRDIARGLLFLHENNVIHRDVKTDNCLIRSINPDASQFAVIADFGISKIAVQFGEKDTAATVGMGTPVYMAPECFSKNQTTKVDVYSFGVVFNETFTEERPWSHIDTKFTSEILNRTESGERPLQNFSEVDYPHKKQICEIIDACWTHDSNVRPDMKIILNMIDTLIAEIASEKPLAYYSAPNIIVPEKNIQPAYCTIGAESPSSRNRYSIAVSQPGVSVPYKSHTKDHSLATNTGRASRPLSYMDFSTTSTNLSSSNVTIPAYASGITNPNTVTTTLPYPTSNTSSSSVTTDSTLPAYVSGLTKPTTTENSTPSYMSNFN